MMFSKLKNRKFIDQIEDVKQFDYKPVCISELETYYNEQGRVYKTPAGDFPSVTTVLGIEGRESIAKWRKRIGEEEADKISFQATNKGTRLHNLCELYTRGRLHEFNETFTPHDVDLFKRFKQVLDKNVGTIYAIEKPLYSNFLRVAGRSDMICDYEGKLSVVDYKTSFKEKKEEYVQKYLMQGSAYCVMYEEMTGTPINTFAIIIVNDYEGVQVFKGKRDDHIKRFMEIREKFRLEYNV